MPINSHSNTDFAQWLLTSVDRDDLAEFFQQHPDSFRSAINYWGKSWQNEVAEKNSKEIQKEWDEKAQVEIGEQTYYLFLGRGLFEYTFKDPAFDDDEEGYPEKPSAPYKLIASFKDLPEIKISDENYVDHLESAYIYSNTETGEEIFVLNLYGLRLPDQSMLSFHAWRLATESEKARMRQIIQQ